MRLKARSIAKITIPQISNVYSRTRLFRCFDDARTRPVVWISGPPGSGKTTLVASYIKSKKLNCLWYQVDVRDEDPAIFFHYLELSLKRVVKNQRKPMPVLRPENRANISIFAKHFFEELYQCLPVPSGLVFENCHEVTTDSFFHKILAEGLALVPEGMSIFVTSRDDPPQALSRLCLNQRVSQIGWKNIQLTEEETRGMTGLRGKRNLPTKTISSLQEWTQGWVAGVVLLLEQENFIYDKNKSIEDFSPSLFFDYFASEIFNKTDKKNQLVLMKTSYFPRFTPGMAHEITGLKNSAKIFFELCRKNYFIVNHSDPSVVFQYHPLFREFLLNQANQHLSPEEKIRIKRKAAGLLEQEGQIEDAAGLWSEVEAWEALVRLVARQASVMVQQGRIKTLTDLLQLIPQEILNETPWLLYWSGICRFPINPAEVRKVFEKAFKLFTEHGDASGIFLSWVGVVDTFLHEWGDFRPLDNWIKALQEMMVRYPEFPSKEIEARVASGMLSAVMFQQPDHPAAAFWFDRSFKLMQEITDANHRMMIGSHHLHFHIWKGDHPKAEVIINSLQHLIHSPSLSPLTKIMWYAMKAVYEFFISEPAASLNSVSQGIEIASHSGVHILDFLLYTRGIYASLVSGDIPLAEDLLRKMGPVLNHSRRLDVSHYHYCTTLVALNRGDVSQAIENGEIALRGTIECGAWFPQVLGHLAFAEALFENKEYQRASRHLRLGRQIGKRCGSKGSEYHYFISAARFAFDRDKEKEGLILMRKAMKLAREGSFMNFPWWSREKAARIFGKAIEAGIEEEYVIKMIRKLELIPASDQIENEKWPWQIKIITLGQFSLLINGSPVQFNRKAQKKPLELLKTVISLGPGRAAGERIKELLWPDAEGDITRGLLDTNIHRLRKLLGKEDAVLFHDGIITLNKKYCWIDIWAFENLILKINERIKNRTSDGHDRELFQMAEKLLALYRGPFLDKDVEHPAIMICRDRLHSQFRRTIYDIGIFLEKSRNWNKSIELYLRGLELDPISEPFYQRLMICYCHLGRKAEAKGVYLRCAKNLADLQGEFPSSETQSIYQSFSKE